MTPFYSVKFQMAFWKYHYYQTPCACQDCEGSWEDLGHPDVLKAEPVIHDWLSLQVLDIQQMVLRTLKTDPSMYNMLDWLDQWTKDISRIIPKIIIKKIALAEVAKIFRCGSCDNVIFHAASYCLTCEEELRNGN